MTTTELPAAPPVGAPALLNLRDSGAVIAAGGALLPGRLYRSAAPVDLGEAELRLLTSVLGIRTAIDLRDDRELAVAPSSLPAAGITVIRAPMGGNPDRAALQTATTPDAVAGFYVDMAVAGAASLAAALTAVADADLPVLVHCAAGKDRTGIAVAMVQELLGVPDVHIAADYAATEGSMAPIRARVAAWQVAHDLGAIPEELLRSRPEVILAFLAAVRRDHGGVIGLLADQGLAADVPDRLRRRLLG